MAYESAISNNDLAAEIADLFRTRRTSIAHFGDSNQGQDTGSHWQSWVMRLKANDIQQYGSKVSSIGDGGYGSDVVGLGIVSWQSANWIKTNNAANATILARCMFSQEEYSTPPTSPYTTTPAGWGLWYEYLQSGDTSPASGNITGTFTLAIDLTGANPIFGADLFSSYTWHLYYSYFIPTGSAGPFNPSIRRGGSFDIFTTDSKTSPVNSITEDHLTMTPVAEVNGGQFQANEINVNQSVGPLFLGPQQVIIPARTTGTAVTPVYVAGGRTLVNIVTDMVYAKTNHPNALIQICQWLVKAHPSGSETLVIVNKMKGNDVGDTSASWVYDSAGSATKTGVAHNTQAGYKSTLEAFIRMVQYAWVAAGYSLANLYFIDGAYHPQPTGAYTVTQALFQAGAYELATNGQSWSNHLLVIYGNELTTSDEMTALSWYKPADNSHLSSAGFNGFNDREIIAILSAQRTPAPDDNMDTTTLFTAQQTSPHPSNYKLFGARLYVRRKGEHGYFCLGNANNISLPTNIASLDHFTSWLGTRRRDRVEIISESYSVDFNLDEMTPENLALDLRGNTISDIHANGSTVSVIMNVFVDRAVKISNKYFLVHGSVSVLSSGDTTTYTEYDPVSMTGDYIVDYELGVITIPNGSTIINGQSVDVRFTVASSTGKSFNPGSVSGVQEIDGFIMGFLDNQGGTLVWEGIDGVIRNNGSVSLNDQDWSGMPMTIDILATSSTTVPYGTITSYVLGHESTSSVAPVIVSASFVTSTSTLTMTFDQNMSYHANASTGWIMALITSGMTAYDSYTEVTSYSVSGAVVTVIFSELPFTSLGSISSNIVYTKGSSDYLVGTNGVQCESFTISISVI